MRGQNSRIPSSRTPRVRRQAAWKPHARLAPKPKKVSEWCPGKLGFGDPALRGVVLLDGLASYTRDQNEIRREQAKYVRCPTCRRRLHPRAEYETFYHSGLQGWSLPRHKRKS